MDRGASPSGCVVEVVGVVEVVEAVEAVEDVELVFVIVVVGGEEVDEERLIGGMAARIAAVLQRGHVKICCTNETMDSYLTPCSAEGETDEESQKGDDQKRRQRKGRRGGGWSINYK